MRKKYLAVLVVTFVACFVSTITFVGTGLCQKSETKAKVPAGISAPVKTNNICPVTGDKVDISNPVTLEYKGKIYNFCSAKCKALFKADPEKYSKVVEDTEKE